MALLLALLFMHWETVLAGMPPSDGECVPSFKEVYPPKMMSMWYVLKHTDNLYPPTPECLIIKFGRRTDFNSEFRMDVVMKVRDPETYMEVETPIMRGNVVSEPNSPFQLVGAEKAFPPNLMVTDLDEQNGCLAVWTCQDMKGTIQKAAWIMCNSPNADEALIQKIEENMSKDSEIEGTYFISTACT